MREKPVIAMEISSKGKGGGPYVSTNRIINSPLNEKYDFKIIEYKIELGRGISIKRIRDLVSQIKKVNPDIVHFTGLQLTGFHMAIACKIAGIKNSLITIRGFSGDALYFHPIKKIITISIIEPITLLLTKKIYANSEYTASRKLVKIFKNKCFGAIYNFPPVPVMFDSTIRKELGLNFSDKIVVSVARINKDKGYHIFDEAIKRFKNINNIKFLIIGNGDYLPEMQYKLMEQVEHKQVYFLGHRDDIQQILKGCDIFVLPTLHETLSIALLEASVEGLALVASNTGGVPEIIEHGFNGLLVEPGNVDELYQAINELICNKNERIRFGINAKKRIDSKFSSKVIEEKIDQVYQDLLNN